MTHRIETTDSGEFYIVTPAGNAARNTASEVFTTPDRAKAEQALAYLAQPVTGLAKRVGPHWLKSTFGVF